MLHLTIDLSDDTYATLRRSPAELKHEVRLAAPRARVTAYRERRSNPPGAARQSHRLLEGIPWKSSVRAGSESCTHGASPLQRNGP